MKNFNAFKSVLTFSGTSRKTSQVISHLDGLLTQTVHHRFE